MNNRPSPNKTRQIGFLVLIFVLLLGTIYSMTRNTAKESLVYSEVIELFETKQVESFTIDTDGNLTMQLRSAYKGQTKYSYECGSFSIFYNDLNDLVQEQKAEGILTEYDYPPAWEAAWWLSFVPYLIIFVIMGVLWYSMMRSAQGGGAGGVMKFSKARTRLGSEEKQKKTFADVAGADEEKEELQEIVEYLKNPAAYSQMGARIPKGVLLVGPPGTGKTLLAKAVAGEAGVEFLSISGSDFVELYVGVGAGRVRDLFEQAKKVAPAIVFIDEIDAVGRQRGSGLGGGHDEREQTLNQLLVEMDGFTENDSIIVMAATNRRDILDPALLRPGRFDRQIVVNYPDIKGREEILKVHTRNKNIGPDVDLKTIAATTAGFTGADLENLVNEAALLAARANRRAITKADIEEATIKVVAGPEKKSKVVTPEEKKLTAYHESGHAITTYFCKSQDKVHQVSIIPRGMAGGFTMHVPEKDRSFVSKTYMEEEIIVLLGGRVAEKLILDDISTGASNDIERATSVARNMVTRYGFSEKLGPILYGHENQEVFLGRDYSQGRNYSENVAAEIDGEIRELIETGYEKAKEILTEHGDLLERCAQYLMKHEKIDGPDFYKLMADEIDIDGNPKKKPEDIAETAPSEETKTETSPTEGIAPAENHEADSTGEPGEDKA